MIISVRRVQSHFRASYSPIRRIIATHSDRELDTVVVPIRRVTAFAALLVALLAGCGQPSATDTNPDGPSYTPFEQLANEVTATGDVTKSLQLFAMQYGTLPDVPPTGLGESPSTEGNLSISAVFDVWSRISETQRRAIRERLGLAPDFDPGVTNSNANISNAGGHPRAIRLVSAPVAVRPGSRSAADFLAAGQAIERVMAARIGPLGVPVEYVLGSHPPITDGAPAYASALVDRGTCRITIYPGLAVPTGPNQTLAHELMHCYQQVWRGRQAMPRSMWWIQEGSAEWVASVIVTEMGGAPDQSLTNNLINWATTPGTALTQRNYDGYGIWAYGNQRDGNQFSRLRAIVTASDTATALAAMAAGSSSADFVAGWAATQFQRQALGPEWYVSGVGVPNPPRTVELSYQPLGNGEVANLEASAFANSRWVRNVTAETLRITLGGATAGKVRLPSGTRDLAELTGQAWCTAQSGQCTCPAGTARAGETLPRLDATTFVAAAGAGNQAASAQLRGRSLQEECGEEADCPVGTWEQTQAQSLPSATIISGGTGTRLIIDADGNVTQSFESYVPITAKGSGQRPVVIHLAPTGEVTGKIRIPASGEFTSAPVTDVNASGLSGSGYVEIGRQRAPLSIRELTQMGFALNASPQGGNGRATQLTCVSDSQIDLVAGPNLRQTYQRVS